MIVDYIVWHWGLIMIAEVFIISIALARFRVHHLGLLRWLHEQFVARSFWLESIWLRDRVMRSSSGWDYNSKSCWVSILRRGTNRPVSMPLPYQATLSESWWSCVQARFKFGGLLCPQLCESRRCHNVQSWNLSASSEMILSLFAVARLPRSCPRRSFKARLFRVNSNLRAIQLATWMCSYGLLIKPFSLMLNTSPPE